jgi:hypothetical protein
MRYLLVTVLVLTFLLAPIHGQETEIVYLSGSSKDQTVDWDFFCTDGRNSGVWTKIAVPSNWELQGFGTYNYGHDENKGNEKGLYKHRFTVPAAWNAKRVFMVFEGVMTDAEVTLNGKPAGPVHQGGFYRFKYDVTGLLEYGGPNLLAVTVSKESADPTVNAAERTSDYWIFGGIYRPVYLEAVPADFIERLAMNPRADGLLTVDVYLGPGSRANRIAGQIRTLDGRNLGAPFEQAIENGQRVVTIGTKAMGHQTWTAETPHLYELELRLRAGRADLHLVREKFGFRTVEMRTGQGIFVNGRKIRLKGINRHSFWPDSGRTTSRELSIMDVNLMKDMNMNAVRMSHYPPDKHFLEACDAVGLYVINELAGWQQAYGTPIGEKLVKELVIRDVNHPSVILWANGNEGGWNTELDGDYAKYDPQRRHVIHPWQLFNGTDTAHYPTYGWQPGRFFQGKDVFFPTEFLHGLYDGGLGAGLEDYWELILANPLGAGGFLWAFVDEGVKRTDRDGIIDTDGNHAPDGLLGPYREKEASYFAVKEIWSPVVVRMDVLPEGFDGEIELENRYDFTSLSDCRFSWKIVSFPLPNEPAMGYKVAFEGTATSPSVGPWSTGKLRLSLPDGWRTQDALFLTARDPVGREIHNWTWMVQPPGSFARRLVGPKAARQIPVAVDEDQSSVTLRAGPVEVAIAKDTGFLKKAGHSLLTNGPALVAGESALSAIRHYRDGDDYVVEAAYEGNLRSVRWRLQPSGWLKLDYEYELTGDFDFLGVSFSHPEEHIRSMRWLGRGPYRVWKNRLRGMTFNVWTKLYNDTRTGVDWNYPEFKGYHSEIYWVLLETTEGPITVAAEDQGVFLRMLTPKNGEDPRHAAAPFPAGDISFLQGIPPVGTKFNQASKLGTQGQPNQASGVYQGTLYFHFGRLAPGS